MPFLKLSVRIRGVRFWSVRRTKVERKIIGFIFSFYRCSCHLVIVHESNCQRFGWLVIPADGPHFIEVRR